jgi:hypothetical protein
MRHEAVTPTAILPSQTADFLMEQARLALTEYNYETAVWLTHQLYALSTAETDQESRTRALRKCLGIHRVFTGALITRYEHSDPYLRVADFNEIRSRRRSGDELGELRLLRKLVNEVAANGTLGGGAKNKVDPAAIVDLEI